MMLATDYSLNDIFNIYHNLVYFGGHSVSDIDNMQPVERDIFFFILKNTIENKNKKKSALPPGFAEI